MTDNNEQQNIARNSSEGVPETYIIRTPSGVQVKTESGATCAINKAVTVTIGNTPTNYSFVTPLNEKNMVRLSVTNIDGTNVNHLQSNTASLRTSDGVIDSVLSRLGKNDNEQRKSLLEQAGISCDKDGVITSKDLRDLAGSSDPVVKPPLPSASTPSTSRSTSKGNGLV